MTTACGFERYMSQNIKAAKAVLKACLALLIQLLNLFPDQGPQHPGCTAQRCAHTVRAVQGFHIMLRCLAYSIVTTSGLSCTQVCTQWVLCRLLTSCADALLIQLSHHQHCPAQRCAHSGVLCKVSTSGADALQSRSGRGNA